MGPRASLLVLGLIGAPASRAALNCPRDTTDRFPSVVKITRLDAPDDPRYCTGTLVQGCFLLTAAHCVHTGDAVAKPEAFKIEGGVSSTHNWGAVSQVYAHPNHVEFGDYDVALLKLARCPGGGMELGYEGLNTSADVTVGGYGARTLHRQTRQPYRHMGPNRVTGIVGRQISIRGATIAPNGRDVVGRNPNCLPIGADSGSPLIQEGKVYGVHYAAGERWNPDGSTTLHGGAAINLSHPEIRSFIGATLQAAASPASAASPVPAAADH
jgi:hypothetical protein